MAQDIQEIFEVIEDQKNSDPVLVDLNSTSDVAVWKGWAFITAFVHRLQQVFWDETKDELDLKASQAVAGTNDWYALKALEFQYGDDLQVINGQPSYPVIDESKRIIKFSSYSEDLTFGATIIKVAKDDGSGNPARLTNDELIAFKYYLNKRKFAGTRVTGASQDSDLLRLLGRVYYNPLVDDLPTLKQNVENAIKEYLRTLPFNGTVKLSSIIQMVKSVEGVDDFTISDAQVSANDSPFVSIARIFVTSAGFIKLDPSSSLTSTLTYEYI